MGFFDESGNKITILDTVKNNRIYMDSSGVAFLLVEDVLYDTKMLEFIGRTKTIKNSNDYEMYLNDDSQYSTIIFNKNTKKKCKLICKSLYYSPTTNEKYNYTIEIPNVEVDFYDFIKTKRSETDKTEAMTNKLMFKILPYNEQGDLFKMHIPNK